MPNTNLSQVILDQEKFHSSRLQRILWKDSLDPKACRALFSWQQMNQCIRTNRLTRDRFHIAVENAGETANLRAFRPASDSLGRSTDKLIIHELHLLMREGACAVLEAVNQLSDTVESFTQKFGANLFARTAANAYASFGETSGFGPHYDDHDVLIIQTEGEKTWRFFSGQYSGVHASVVESASKGTLVAGEQIVMKAGNVMFIPKGVWHDAVSSGTPSLHLTVSQVYPTIKDFIHWGVKFNKFGTPFIDLHLDKEIKDELIGECNEFFENLNTPENFRAFLNYFFAAKAANRIQPDFPRLNVVGKIDSVVRVPWKVAEVEEMPYGGYRVFALGAVHHLSNLEFKVLKKLSNITPTTRDALCSSIGCIAEMPNALQRLVDAGLATIQAAE